jgi:exopolysaccharide biosynthesis polyprenyl glycosylphosphotransferase
VVALVVRSVAAADLAILGLQLAVALLVARGLAVVAMRALSRRGWVRHRVLIVGSGEVAERLARAVREHPSTGMRITGLVDDDASAAVTGLARLGGLSELEDVARRHRIDRILLAFSSKPEAQMVRLLVDCERVSADIYAVPRFFEVGVDMSTPDEISGIPLMILPRPMRRRMAVATKRAFDLVVSLMTLTLLSPVLIAVAALVRFTGPRPFVGKRPVIFRQHRVGLDGRLFTMLKFRSMIPNDDGDMTWSVAGDPRVTRLGSFLRRSGLDEAPQLWNVVRGDMSLVGPRPERPLMVDIFTASISEYQTRQRVRPGITGWAQVNGLRGDTSIVDRARLDNYYVATWTFMGDMVILLRTAALLLRHLVPRVAPRRAATALWSADLTGVAMPGQRAEAPAAWAINAANLPVVAQTPMLHADSG